MAVGLTTEDSAAEIRQRQATLISPGYPPTIGGVETHVGRLADGLTNHGVHVSVYAGSPERSQVGVRDSDGVAVRIFRGFNVMSMTLSPRLLLHASRIRDRGALVHVHSYHSLSGFAVTLVGRGPVVFTPHYHGDGHTPLAAALHRAYHLVGRRLFRRADAIVCVSESERELLESDYSFVRGKTFVVPNAIDTESIQSASPFPQDDRVVLSVGRLESYKNVDVLLRAFAAVGLQMLFDMRRYLPASGNLSVGNGAKSLFIESDVTDPASISHEMKKSQNVKRALPSTVLGAAMSLLPKSSASIYETAQSPSERLLTMSIMPRLPHMEHSASIPWHDDHRVTGIGLSDAVGSISVFAVYGDQTIDLVTAVAETDPDRAAVRRAFDRLTNPSSVLRTDHA